MQVFFKDFSYILIYFQMLKSVEKYFQTSPPFSMFSFHHKWKRSRLLHCCHLEVEYRGAFREILITLWNAREGGVPADHLKKKSVIKISNKIAVVLNRNCSQSFCDWLKVLENTSAKGAVFK